MNIFFLFYFSLFGFSQKPILLPTEQVLSAKPSEISWNISTAGGDSIGGGDSLDVRRQTTWFYGTRDIATCFQLTENFGLSEAEVYDHINQSINIWQDYFKQKKINSEIPEEQKINTNFKLQKRCRGGEDLVFYFGTGPIFGNLSDLRARQYLSSPVAYVNKTHMAKNYQWSKGYVRFVEPFVYSTPENQFFPDWNLHQSFLNILIHEMGHILGFIHVQGTIMDKEISRQHYLAHEPIEIQLPVDQDKELYTCQSCSEIYYPADKNILTWQKIEFKKEKTVLLIDEKSIFFELKHQISTEPELSLLSMFEPNNFQQKTMQIMFLNINQDFFTFEFLGSSLIVRQNGNIQGSFLKESP